MRSPIILSTSRLTNPFWYVRAVNHGLFVSINPCIIDPSNPLKAISTCEIERKQPFITFGGECNTLTCDTAYWSGATVSDFEGASQELMKAFGLKENPAQYCPGQNPK
jgi:hypothetical protein